MKISEKSPKIRNIRERNNHQQYPHDTVNLSADGIARPSQLLTFSSFYSAQVVSINSVRLCKSAITQYLPIKLQCHPHRTYLVAFSVSGATRSSADAIALPHPRKCLETRRSFLASWKWAHFHLDNPPRQ